jgi:hypothetical protein
MQAASLPRPCARCSKHFEHPNQQTRYCTVDCAHAAGRERDTARARLVAKKKRVKKRFMAKWDLIPEGVLCE